MNKSNFFKSFHFSIYSFQKYHLTDRTKTPNSCHFFACLIKGNGKIKTKDTELNLAPGEIFFIPKGLRYQSQWFREDGKEVKFFSFGFEFSPSAKSFDLQKVPCTDKAKEIFKELCEEIPTTEKGIGKLYCFFAEVSENMKETKSPHINPIVRKALEYIAENPTIRNSEIAKLCSISESGLYLIFKKHTGKTPNEIRLEVLCEKAILWLTTTNKSVQEISDTLNFSSTSYFRKVLKKFTGKTPREIRKNSFSI